jgi:hypothetical protein
MASDFVPVVLAGLAALYFVQDGYQARPTLSWGNRTGKGAPISLLSRWVLGCYLVLLASLVLPGVRARLPNPWLLFIAVGFLLALVVTGMLDASSSKSGGRPFRLSKRRASALSSSEQRQLRRERKQQRLRRTKPRRDS